MLTAQLRVLRVEAAEEVTSQMARAKVLMRCPEIWERWYNFITKDVMKEATEAPQEVQPPEEVQPPQEVKPPEVPRPPKEAKEPKVKAAKQSLRTGFGKSFLGSETRSH